MDVNLNQYDILIADNRIKPFLLLKKQENPFLNFKLFSLYNLQTEVFGKVNKKAIPLCINELDVSFKFLKDEQLVEEIVITNTNTNIIF